MAEKLKKYRHGLLLLYFPFYLAAFAYLEKKVPDKVHIINCAIDQYIPFVEVFIIPLSLIHIQMCIRDRPGIDIIIKPGTKKESVHIPVVISQTGLNDLVYNDFHIGEDCDVTIVAGCGIHNSGDGLSQHDGIHEFFVGKNSKIRYIEKHYGQGDGCLLYTSGVIPYRR